MGKRVVDEEMRFSIIINGDPAQKELQQLDSDTRKLTATNKNLRAERDKLRAQGKQNTAEYKKLTAAIKQNNSTLDGNKARMKELQHQIGVTGLTMAQLQRRASQLKLQLRNMIPGSAEYKRLQLDLTATNSRIKQLATQANAAKFSLRGLADGFNRYTALGVSVIAGLTGIVFSIQRVIDFNSELADAQSNVQKTTSLTKDEVEDLTKSFGDFDTRSTRMELLALSEEAGRLGIRGVENIRGFVESANQIKVALGDDLSDEAIREVGKMTNIFQVGEQTGRNFEQSMQSLGSAINAISASGANTADFLVDFMKRTAGVAGVADIQAGKIIGIAAAFDELGQSREISATAMNKTLLSMGKDVEKFSGIAGLSIAEFSKLLEEDANEALLMFLEGLNKGNPSMETMAKRLDGIEVGGTRGVQAMAALAANIDLVRKRQEDANVALFENTSLIDEYNIKNENTAALLSKIRRRLIGTFASENITNGISNLIEWFAKFIGATEDGDGSVTSFRNGLVFSIKVFAVITVAIFSYNKAIALSAMLTGSAYKQTLLYTAALRAKNIITRLSTSLTAAYIVVTNLLTGSINLATAATRLFNIAIRANPIGLLISLITAGIVALFAFRQEVEKVETAQEKYNNSREKANKGLTEEIENIRKLEAVAKDETASINKRREALEDLNKIIPGYNENLSLTKEALEESTKASDKYIESLINQAQAKIMVDDIANVREEIEKVRKEFSDEMPTSASGQVWKMFTASFFGAAGPRTGYMQASERLTRLKKEQTNMLEAYQKFIKDKLIPTSGNEDDVDPVIDPDPIGGDDDPFTVKLEQLKKEAEAIYRLRAENADLEANQNQDAFYKELELMDNNHNEKMRRLKAQKVEESEIKNVQTLLDEAIADDTNPKIDRTEDINNFTKILELWADKNAEINEQIRLEQFAHQKEIGTLIREGIEMDVQVLEKAYQAEQSSIEQRRNAQLAEVANSQRKTRDLKEQFRQEDLVRERNHVMDIQKMVREVLDSGQFEGFDIDLLTEEQKDQIVSRLQQLGLEISQINLLLAQMSNGGQGDALGDLGLGGNTDILGFTPEQWEVMFSNFSNLENVLESVVMVAAAASNAFAMFSNMRSKNENARMQQLEQNNNREKQILKDRLDSGYINERQYNDAVANMDEELEKKKEELAKKQAEREQTIALNSIAINTAKAIMGIWADFPKVDFGATAAIMTGFVSALGVAQAAMVLSTPGYEEGFYREKFPVKREQDGKMFNAVNGGMSRSGIVNQPTMFLAGEEGKRAPEMIITGGDYAKLTPDLKETLNRQLSTVRGFQDGFYKEDSSTSKNDELLNALFIMVSKNSKLLDTLIKDGIIAKVIANESNARELQEALDKFKKRKESSKL
jgi:tubulin-specific chaperone A